MSKTWFVFKTANDNLFAVELNVNTVIEANKLFRDSSSVCLYKALDQLDAVKYMSEMGAFIDYDETEGMLDSLYDEADIPENVDYSHLFYNLITTDDLTDLPVDNWFICFDGENYILNACENIYSIEDAKKAFENTKVVSGPFTDLEVYEELELIRLRLN